MKKVSILFAVVLLIVAGIMISSNPASAVIIPMSNEELV